MPDSGDLLNRSFEKASFGGYKAADVDSFMTELATTLSQSGREVTELKRKLVDAEKKISNFESEEESLKSTLLSVQRLADKIKKDAEEKASITIQDAKIKAENLIDSAQGEIEMRKDEAVRIKKEVSDFKLSVMRLYKSQLELINEIPSEKPQKSEEPEKTAAQSENQTEAAVQEPVTTAQDSKPPLPKPEPVVKNTADPLKKTLEQLLPTTVAVTGAASSDTCEFVLGTHVSSAVKTPKMADGAEKKVKTTAIPQKMPTMPEKIQNAQQSVTEQVKQTEKETAVAAAPKAAAPRAAAPIATSAGVKLNLQYNEKTGEYEPIGAMPQDDSSRQGEVGDGLRFGADYNLRTDSFSDSNSGSGSSEAGHRAPWRK